MPVIVDAATANTAIETDSSNFKRNLRKIRYLEYNNIEYFMRAYLSVIDYSQPVGGSGIKILTVISAI